MAIPTGKLTTLQESVAAFLAAVAEFAGAGVVFVTSRNGSIQGQVDEALAGLLPTVTIYPPAAGSSKPNPSVPFFERVALTVRVTLDPNGPFEGTAMDVGELILRCLHHALVDISDTKQVQLVADIGGECLFPIDHPSWDIVDVLFFTTFGLDPYPAS